MLELKISFVLIERKEWWHASNDTTRLIHF